MTADHILLLAGTHEARQLAAVLRECLPEVRVTASFAGVVSELPDLGVSTRVGGFGGVEGLARFLVDNEVSLIVDATHPFAAQMSRNALSAAGNLKLPLIRLERPRWQEASGDRWLRAGTIEEAARMLPVNARALLAIGRKEIEAFVGRSDIYALARMIEPPAVALPRHWDLVLSKPAGSVEEEHALLKERRISHVVAKNSGGTLSYGKIAAARSMSIPVIMVERPELTYAVTVGTADEALQRAAGYLDKRP